MNRWIKVDNQFLNEALVSAIKNQCGECEGILPSSYRDVKIHAFTQICERHMKISWENKNRFGEIEMGMCVVDSYFWKD